MGPLLTLEPSQAVTAKIHAINKPRNVD